VPTLRVIAIISNQVWHASCKARNGGYFMNSDQLEGKWKQMKGTVKERWGKLTDDDLTVIAGKKDILVGRLQERYGVTREEAQKQADEFHNAHFPAETTGVL